ncbi:MAG: type II toxin-antitoxin system VapC family toxin [Hyphomicrobium aestuarii]|nr:type II toxin-antitoxin system VapC family toxin [Hyphomicrobium aestuarii]
MLGASNTVFVGAATAWEIAVKYHIGKLEFDFTFLSNFDNSVRQLGFEPIAVTSSHAVRGAEIKAPHKDPFDRMLAGQALVEGATLVSADPAFDWLGVETWWR